MAEDFISRHVRKLRSAGDMERTIRRELLPRWGAKPIDRIGKRDIVALVGEIADSARLHIAHHIYSYTSKIFAWAIARGLCDIDVSPCASIKRSEILAARAARQRVLADAEIRALWRTTESLGYPAAQFIQLLLLTGQRRREVAEMAWPELDLGARPWCFRFYRKNARRPPSIGLMRRMAAFFSDVGVCAPDASIWPVDAIERLDWASIDAGARIELAGPGYRFEVAHGLSVEQRSEIAHGFAAC